MKHWFFILIVCAFLVAPLMLVTDADAARIGGGRSFGGQSSMRTPTAAPRPAQPRQQPSAVPAGAPRPSTGLGGMGAMGGLFGGLLAGTVLGSLLGHGGGVAGGGGGIGFIDIILLGVLIWLGLKFYRKMQQNRPQPQAQPSYEQNYSYQDQQTGYYDQQGWNDQPGSSGAFGAPQVPAGFNVEEFLQGAKQAYVRLQSSWDQRDMADIANFATNAVMQELQKQMAEDPNPSHTELININLQLMEVADDGKTQRAKVFFDVLMREDPNQLRPEPAREIWHFVRTLPNGTWKLDGIQQTYD